MFGGCSLNKLIPDDKILYKKAKLVNPPSRHEYKLTKLIKQRPKERSFGISRPYLWIYMKMDRGRQTRIKNTIKNTFGIEPTYLDSIILNESTQQMQTYLFNNGYFNANVDFSVKTKKKIAKVKFNIEPDEPYTIRNVQYFIPDRKIESIILGDTLNSVLKKGKIYDIDDLTKERTRIAKLLNNNGYYKFSKYYLYFEVDTGLLEKQKTDIEIFMRNLSDTSRHKVYYFKNISVEPNYNVLEKNPKDTLKYDDFQFIVSNEEIKPAKFIRHIKLSKGDLFELDKVRLTINQLSEVQMFKFVDVIYEEEDTLDDNIAYLDCLIRLTPLEKRKIVFDSELNTTDEERQIYQVDRYYGIAGNMTFRSRNLFNSWTQGVIKLGGAFDVPYNKGDSNFFDTIPFEIKLTTSLYFPTAFLPRSLFGISLDNLFETSKTAITLSYYYENNLDFKRHTANFSYTYQFDNERRKHFFTPVEISLVSTEILDDSLRARINSLPLLKSLFDTHMLTITRWTFVYNNKGLKYNRYFRIRTSMESAGNVSYSFNKVFNMKTDPEGRYEILGIDFNQYLKFDFDLSYYYILNERSSLAYRFNLGMAYPYLNSTDLPFEKSYYAGGANSIRAWKPRDLGPGSWNGELFIKKDSIVEGTLIDHIGDIRFETNLEIRFDMFSILKGALFADVGNIWLWEADATEASIREGGEFRFKDFFNELALGSGFGLRFDFTFIVFRTDFAIRLHDPALESDPWVISNIFSEDKWFDKNFRINIGIGYPF